MSSAMDNTLNTFKKEARFDETEKALNNMGISVYDENGNFKSLSDVLSEMSEKLEISMEDN